MFFKSKKRIIEELLEAYGEQVRLCVHAFEESLKAFCVTGDRVKLMDDAARVHKAESKADDIRYEIEVMLYARALFPESRGDVLILLETADQVPDKAQRAIRAILNQSIAIPETLHPKMLELASVCTRCVDAMLEAMSDIFTNLIGATTHLGIIDELESQADRIEAHLIQDIFRDNAIPEFDRILLRDLVFIIAGISDRAESVADRIRIIVAKRAF
jgi:predicted phosphate transport protein (TIGR00153 family)